IPRNVCFGSYFFVFPEPDLFEAAHNIATDQCLFFDFLLGPCHMFKRIVADGFLRTCKCHGGKLIPAGFDQNLWRCSYPASQRRNVKEVDEGVGIGFAKVKESLCKVELLSYSGYFPFYRDYLGEAS